MKAKVLSTLFASFLIVAASTKAPELNAFGETCVGTVTIQVGAQPLKTAAYNLTFSVDLARKSYCYGACGKDQTYAVSDPWSSPIKLADTDSAGQVRRMSFDRNTSQLADYQIINSGIAKVTRTASASCKPASFKPPWPLPE